MMDAKELQHLEELAAQGEQVEHARRVLPQIKHRQQLEARQQAAKQRAAELEEVVAQKLDEFKPMREESQIKLHSLAYQVKLWIEEAQELNDKILGDIKPIVEEMLKARIIAQNPEHSDSFGLMDEHVHIELRYRLKRQHFDNPQKGWRPLFFTMPDQPDEKFDKLLRSIVQDIGKLELDGRPKQPTIHHYAGPNGREIAEADWH